MDHRRPFPALLLLALGLGFGPAGEAWSVSRPEQAEQLYRQAMEAERRDTFDSRRKAVDCLERASALAPDSVSYHLALARLYYRMGFLGQARRRYERLGALSPDLPEAHLGQGLAWRRDYLKYLDPLSLTRAVDRLERAARLAPHRADAWLQLVPLLVEQGRLPAALEASERAWAAEPRRPDGLLAVAHAAFRLGQVERADSAFKQAIPRLPRAARLRFDDIAPVAAEEDTAALRKLPPAERPAFVQRFWRDNDPDLATSENEAQLEYWSRVTQAYFLFFHHRRQEWDQRGEVYVRYGPPEKAEYNPVGTSLRFQMGSYGVFPMNVLVWSYPGLGMTVPMQDRLLSEYYLPPMSMVRSMDPAPHPDSLERRDGQLATAGGRGVFPLLPPGSRPLPVAAVLARFQGESGPRLLAWLESPGSPGDSLWAEWVVLDSARREVARTRRPLSPSACDPAEFRTADFAAELPPGEYLAGLSVRGPGGRRGVHRERLHLDPAGARLDLSDVLVSCGAPPPGSGPDLRLSVNPGARVSGGEPLTVYFETYHLASGTDGLSRFEIEYTVRSAERDPRIWIQRLIAPRRVPPPISALRQEEQRGPLRRQFVTVPVAELPRGRYLLEIRVRDLNAGRQSVRTAEFVRV